MPDVLVEVAGPWLGEQRTAFLLAVHDAMARALGTPVEDPIARLVEHPDGCFRWPDGASGRFTRIQVELFRGRSLPTKRALYRALVAALEPFGVPPQDVKIVLIEVPPENAGLRGGQAACDVELGYAVDV